MSITRHAPDPLHIRETLCGHMLVPYGDNRHHLASVGDGINCADCRVVANWCARCVLPHRYLLVKAP